MKKRFDVAAITNELKDGSVFFRKPTEAGTPLPTPDSTKKKPSPLPVTQLPTQTDTYLSKQIRKNLSTPINTDAIEALSFQLRRTPKERVSADIPTEWKNQLDDLTHELKVGKYELVMYIIGRFLGEAR